MYTVRFASQSVKKRADKLPEDVLESLADLLRDLIHGPAQPRWRNYSKLRGTPRGKPERHHCHLNGGGKARYVAEWQVYKNILTVEIYNVRKHPKQY